MALSEIDRNSRPQKDHRLADCQDRIKNFRHDENWDGRYSTGEVVAVWQFSDTVGYRRWGRRRRTSALKSNAGYAVEYSFGDIVSWAARPARRPQFKELISKLCRSNSDLVVEWTQAGLARARSQGKMLGRPPKTNQEQRTAMVAGMGEAIALAHWRAPLAAVNSIQI